jgi:hypothetical protein
MIGGEAKMRRSIRSLSAGCLALGLAAAASAHHSRHATFDPDDRVTLTGTVTNLEWRNPHIWVFFDVAGEDGATTAWACEGGAPNALFRRGWRPDSLKPGDAITIDGERARNGSANCNMRSVRLTDGSVVFAGDAGSPGDPAAGAGR